MLSLLRLIEGRNTRPSIALRHCELIAADYPFDVLFGATRKRLSGVRAFKHTTACK